VTACFKPFFSAALLLVVSVNQPACRAVDTSSRSSISTAGAAISTGNATTVQTRSHSEAAHFVVETIDLATCQSPKPDDKEEEQGDGLIRCSLSSGLIAEQNGSACFDVNRLLDAEQQPLFESEISAPDGNVFVVETKFELYRCKGRPVIVLQGGQYFTQDTSVENPCHGKKALRQAYQLQDIANQRLHSDLPLSQARVLIDRILRTAGCD
jgi:hypothetical protein